jgi:hypothetical protein
MWKCKTVSIKKFYGRRVIIFYTKDDNIVECEGILTSIYKNMQEVYSIGCKNNELHMTISSPLIQNVKIEYYPIEFEKILEETNLHVKLNNDVIKEISQIIYPFMDL